MTYRNKLLIKRTFIALLILLLLLAVVGVIALIHLGKYVVYTEDGAYFSFLHTEEAEAEVTEPAAVGSEYSLVIGDPISAGEVLGSDDHYIADSEIKGLFVDYDTLMDGTTLETIDLSSGEYNTLMLEMRRNGSEMLNSLAVQQLLHRAQTQEIRLIAQINCLTDDSYAAANPQLGLQLYDGLGLWAGYMDTYFLDLRQQGVITYLADLVRQLSEMGFDEVVLDEFRLPESGYIDYGDDERTLEEAVSEAYTALVNETVNYCDIGLLIRDPSEGHQGIDTAERIYVYYHSGSRVQSYLESHSDHYLVFITDSHDTRFDAHGKIFSENDLGLEEAEAETESEETDEA